MKLSPEINVTLFVPVANFKDSKDTLSSNFSGIEIVPFTNVNELISFMAKRSIDIVFPSHSPLGKNFPFTWVGYVYDLQHKHMPQNFTNKECEFRDNLFIRTLRESDSIMVASQDVKNDLSKFYPDVYVGDKIYVMPFRPSFDEQLLHLEDVSLKKYHLPNKYFIISNQFWIHKDHSTAFEALALLHKADSAFKDVHIVCTGKTEDYRDPDYIKKLEKKIKTLGLRDKIHFLGYIPKRDQIKIMRGAIASVQPTLFEGGAGGGMTLEAVAFGKRVILSDIPVNKEIDNPLVTFFKAGSPEDLQSKMLEILSQDVPVFTDEELLTRSRETRTGAKNFILNLLQETLKKTPPVKAVERVFLQSILSLQLGKSLNSEQLLSKMSDIFSAQKEVEDVAPSPRLPKKIKIPVYQPELSGNEKKYVNECLDTNWISSQGKFVREFESNFAKYIGVNHAVAVSNGTVALHLALLAIGIRAGDEVICPTLTYIASANAIRYTGATPVFVDSLRDTWQIDPADVEKKITNRTRAIMVVHLYGQVCDMDRIMEIADKHDLFVIEDCAEAFGSKFHEKFAGSFGHVSAFSFYGNKTITCGEGGMVTTNDMSLYYRIAHLKGQGQAKYRQYWHDIIGYNYRMTNICAAIGLAQLEKADDYIARKRQLANWYMEFLKDTPVTFQKEAEDTVHTWWMNSILVPRPEQRDELREHLAAAGIETRPLFYPIHTMPMYSEQYQKHAVAEDVGLRGMNLPSYPALKRENIEYICNSVKEFFKN